MGVRPSEFAGLKKNSIEAYFLDEAVIYFGLNMENMLDSAGHKPGKEERKSEAARKQLIGKIFGEDDQQGSGFADPAAMFG